jgi:hypothetical protein
MLAELLNNVYLVIPSNQLIDLDRIRVRIELPQGLYLHLLGGLFPGLRELESLYSNDFIGLLVDSFGNASESALSYFVKDFILVHVLYN